MSECKLDCCSKWKIALTEEDIDLWKKEAPDLLYLVCEKIDDDGSKSYITSRTPERVCLAMDNGLCKIHRDYGEKFLPDLCKHFPHSSKKIGDDIIITATMGCPAVCDIALNAKYGDFKIEYTNEKKIRDNNISDYTYRVHYKDKRKFNGLYNKIINLFYNKKYTSGEIMAILSNIVRCSNDNEEMDINFYKFVKKEEISIKKIKFSNLTTINPWDIIHTMNAITSLALTRQELLDMVKEVEKKLKIDGGSDINPLNLTIITENWNEIRERWNSGIGNYLDSYLKNFIMARLNQNVFPFCSHFTDNWKQIVFIAFEFLLLRLSFMCLTENINQAKSKTHIREITSKMQRTFYGGNSENIYREISKMKWDSGNKLFSGLIIH